MVAICIEMEWKNIGDWVSKASHICKNNKNTEDLKIKAGRIIHPAFVIIQLCIY